MGLIMGQVDYMVLMLDFHSIRKTALAVVMPVILVFAGGDYARLQQAGSGQAGLISIAYAQPQQVTIKPEDLDSRPPWLVQLG